MNKIADHFRFLRALLTRPRSIGAVMPSGPQLARAMAAQIPGGLIANGARVLELGPGTGCITEAILARVPAAQLSAIEYDGEFAAALKQRFPNISVIQGDAFDLDATLRGAATPFAAVISGLPLLNFSMPERHRLVEGALTRLAPGGVLVQFSYGRHAPVVPPAGWSVAQADFVLANVPPARVWVYRKI